MALTFAELVRLAPHLGADPPAVADGRVDGRTPEGGRWSIELAPLPDRAIGLFRFPVAAVTVRLDGLDADGEVRFLDRFHRVFQKGGG